MLLLPYCSSIYNYVYMLKMHSITIATLFYLLIKKKENFILNEYLYMYFWRLGGDQDMCRCNWVLLSPGLGWLGDWQTPAGSYRWHFKYFLTLLESEHCVGHLDIYIKRKYNFICG